MALRNSQASSHNRIPQQSLLASKANHLIPHLPLPLVILLTSISADLSDLATMSSVIVANATTLAAPLELNRTARDAALYQEDDDDEDEAQWSAPEEKPDGDDDDDNVTHTGNARAKRPPNSQIINLSGPDSDSDDDDAPLEF